MRTTARFDGGERFINGEKTWPSGAGKAGLYCVVCTTDTARSEEGTVGLSFGAPEKKMGMRVTDVNAPIYFDGRRQLP